MKNDVFITEISEEDFVRLNLIAYEQVWETVEDKKSSACTKLVWREVKLNEVLYRNVEYWFNSGYEKDYEDLKQPVTIAIHVQNGPNPKDYYFDKFLNRYSGFKTYEIAMGLKHVYSTRDYFESKEDYWRVLKRETKAIYRVHLNPEFFKHFKLKHKTEIAYIFRDSCEGNAHYIEKSYDLDEATDEWKLASITEVKIRKDSSSYNPMNINEE